jgi:hypothetical protein
MFARGVSIQAFRLGSGEEVVIIGDKNKRGMFLGNKLVVSNQRSCQLHSIVATRAMALSQAHSNIYDATVHLKQ